MLVQIEGTPKVSKGKICLVTPPSGFLLDQRVFVSLGILKIGAVLEQAGWEVDHLDLTGVANYEEAAADYKGCELFAITATTPQIPAAVRIRKVLKGKTILGGPHPTLVHAAVKRGNQRALAALDFLMQNFDTVVAGDGEKSIFRAIREYGLIDADDPKSDLWVSSKEFSESPLPARHLVDMASYHYTVDGEKATSAVFQLGCLTAETPILMADGKHKPICDIIVGDVVLSYEGGLVATPVFATWKREAPDAWEIECDNGSRLCITSEHPVLTNNGWKKVEGLEIGDYAATVRAMPPTLSNRGEQYTEVLRSPVPIRMAEDPRKSKMDAGGAGQDACKICRDDPRREDSLLHGNSEQSPQTNRPHTELAIGDEAREQESDEEDGSSGQSFNNHQREVENVLFRPDEEDLGSGTTEVQSRGSSEFCPEQAGNDSGRDHTPELIGLRVRGEWGVLDRTLPIREAAESRFYKQEDSSSNPASRGVLAHARGCATARERLSGQGLEHTDGLEFRTESFQPQNSDREDPVFWRIKSKKFLGTRTVHNITVHPVHNYIADGVVVHNCPFECGFCGGRFSPMLRRIRSRTADSVVAEMLAINEKYGLRGLMAYDDELNVNKGLVELCQKIKATGIDWRLRGFVKAELFNEEQAKAMYDAGFRWLLCGFESAHPRILKNINKKASLEDNTRMLRTAHKYGLKVKALMSFGHPGESEETILATRDWLLAEKPDDFDCTVITTYPGTPYWDNAVLVEEPVYRYEFNGDALYMENTDPNAEVGYYKGKPGEYKAFVWTDYLSAPELVRLRDEVESEVRGKLNIPYPAGAAALQYEHSVGQRLPANILKTAARL